MKSTKELKTINLNEKSFKANGKEYFIESGLSFKRYRMYQMSQIECGYDVSFKTMFETLKKAYENLDKMKLAQSAVLIHNLLEGIAKVEERKIPVLSMCALFINEKDEDRTIITDEMVDRKIADWEAEGLEIHPFFQLALSSIQNFSNAWQEISRSISEQISQEK